MAPSATAPTSVHRSRRRDLRTAAGVLTATLALTACSHGAPVGEHPPTVAQTSHARAQHVALNRPAATPSPTPSGPLRIAALGDSVPSGLGAPSYVPMVGKALAAQQHRALVVSNEAVAGVGSQDVVASLQDLGGHEVEAVRSADVTIVEVGANDFDELEAQDPTCAPVTTSGCYTDTVNQLRQDMTSIVETVKKNSKPGARIVLVGYWNLFVDGAVGASMGAGYVDQGRALARWVNSTVSSVARSEGVSYADAYGPFVDSKDITADLQPDGDHPNTAGHQLIADAVLAALGSSARV